MATLLLLPPLLADLGYEAGLVAEIRSFLWAICWGVPGFLAAAVLRFQLTAAFRTRVVMVVPIMAVPLNLILNWVLIFGHWGLPALGSAGSGCATAIVQWLTLASFAAYMRVAKAAISPSIGRGVLRQIPGILRLGLPIAAMRGLEIGMFVMTGVLMGVIVTDTLCPACTVPLAWPAVDQTLPFGSVLVITTCQVMATLLPVLSIVTVSAGSVGVEIQL